VSRTAREWDFPFALWIQPELLRDYLAPSIYDDEGYYLTGEIIKVIDAALDGRLECGLTSLGKYLSCEVPLVAQHRRRDAKETLALWILAGPCDSDRPAVYVMRIEPPF
jgi:hypothetical protein